MSWDPDATLSESGSSESGMLEIWGASDSSDDGKATTTATAAAGASASASASAAATAAAAAAAVGGPPHRAFPSLHRRAKELVADPSTRPPPPPDTYLARSPPPSATSSASAAARAHPATARLAAAPVVISTAPRPPPLLASAHAAAAATTASSPPLQQAGAPRAGSRLGGSVRRVRRRRALAHRPRAHRSNRALEAVLEAKTAAARAAAAAGAGYTADELAELERGRVREVRRARKKRRTLVSWEAERKDVAWRWTWLQLQIDELKRTRDSYSRGLDEYQRDKPKYAPAPGDDAESARSRPLAAPLPRRKMCKRAMTRVRKKVAADDPRAALLAAKRAADRDRKALHRLHSGPHPLVPDAALVAAAVAAERAPPPPPPRVSPGPATPARPPLTVAVPPTGSARLHRNASASAIYRSMPKLLESPRVPPAISLKLGAAKRSSSGGGSKSSKSKAALSTGSKSKGKRSNKRRAEEFNINNIVVPFAPASAPTARAKLEVKEIVLPFVRDIGEDKESDDEADPEGGSESPAESDSVIADAVVFARHAVYEVREREKYLGIPNPPPLSLADVPLPHTFYDYGRDADSMREGARQYLLELEAAEAGELFDSLSDEYESDDLDAYLNGNSDSASDDDGPFTISRKRKRGARANLLNARQRRKWERLKFEFLEFARLNPDQVSSLFGLWSATPARSSLIGLPSYPLALVPPDDHGLLPTIGAAPTPPAPATSLLLRRTDVSSPR